MLLASSKVALAVEESTIFEQEAKMLTQRLLKELTQRLLSGQRSTTWRVSLNVCKERGRIGTVED